MSCQGSRWAMYISNWCWNIFVLYGRHVVLAIYLNWWYLFTSQGSCFTLQWKLILNIFFKFWSHNIWDWSIIVFISSKKVHMSLGQKLVQCFITAFTDSIGFAVTSWIPNPFSFGKDNLMWSQNICFLYVSKYWMNNGFFFSAPLRLFHLAVSLLRRNSYDSLVSQYSRPPFPKSSLIISYGKAFNRASLLHFSEIFLFACTAQIYETAVRNSWASAFVTDFLWSEVYPRK